MRNLKVYEICKMRCAIWNHLSTVRIRGRFQFRVIVRVTARAELGLESGLAQKSSPTTFCDFKSNPVKFTFSLSTGLFSSFILFPSTAEISIKFDYF